jgi:hypothetical protein
MKTPTALFIFFISLTTLISACGPMASAPDVASGKSVSLPVAPASPATSSPRVRIVHSWIEHKDSVTYFKTEFGLGTAVGTSTILTHNHFIFPPELRDDETLTFTFPTGQAFSLPMSDIAAVAVDAGTQVFYLPSYVVLEPAPLGDQVNLNQLQAGMWLQVDYWDDAKQRFAQGNFEVERLEPGVATLADPLHVIRPGDSGGGIYLAGKLIGNTWAMYVDPDTKQPIGEFNVALLPVGAMALLRPEQTSVAAVLPSGAAGAGERQ